MNLFQRLKIWKELKRLGARARENPSPSTYVDLGQVYINLGMCERTLLVADEGLALFPDSEELRTLRNCAQKSQLGKRINEVRARLNKSPDADDYRELAGLYLELGDFGAVHGTCEECIRRFPDDAEAHLILGKARLTSFYRDLSARDGLEAIRCLQKAIRLESSAKGHKLLAEVLYRIGAVSQTIKHLERVREIDPTDQEVDTLYSRAKATNSAGEDLDVLFHNVEATGALMNAPVTRETKPVPAGVDESISRIRDALAQIAELAGVRKAAYIKGAKALVKGEITDGRDGFLRVVRVVAKASQRFSRRMDIGNFNKGIIDGEFGHICICSYGEVVAGVLCDQGSPVDRVLTELQDLVTGSLYVAGVNRP